MEIKPLAGPKALKTSLRSANSTHVPDKLYGYTVQSVRCLARLIEADPGSTVSVEVFEDVGVSAPNGRRLAEQDKSALGHNPVSDRAEGLWKTLSNWVDAANRGELNPETTQYLIYVTTPKNDTIVSSFHATTDSQSASAAITAAITELWGEPPNHDKRPSVATTIARYVENVFTCDPQVVGKIICAFTLISGTGSIVEDVRMLLKRTLVPEDLATDVTYHALGWVTDRITKAIENYQPANLSVDTFRNDLRAYIRQRDGKLMLHSVAPAPSSDNIRAELAVRRYVRQLRLIDCDDEEQIEAVVDFLKAAVDRTDWAAQGHIDEVALDCYEECLTATWKNVRRKVEIAYANLDASKRGHLIKLECTGLHLHLDTTEVPWHFSRGSFHTLADQADLGWHPDYKQLID